MPYDWSCKPTYRWLWRGKNKYYNINKRATGRKLSANREHHTRRFWEWSRSTTQEDGTFNSKEALPSVVYDLPTIIARIAPKRWKHYWLFAMTEANWVEREQIRTCCRPVYRNASKSIDTVVLRYRLSYRSLFSHYLIPCQNSSIVIPWVTERSVHFAIPAICDVVNFFLLCTIWTIISCCQDSRFRAMLWSVVWLMVPSWDEWMTSRDNGNYF